MKRIIIIIWALFICSQAYSQYIGWGIKRIGRNVSWECDCDYETVKLEEDKYIIRFSDELGITEMVFYMNDEEKCYGYSVYCENPFEKKLREFIEKNYTYVDAEDYYQNRRSYLFYQSDREKKIIHVITRNASSDNAKPF
ncbi:MAG: hypothetical protein ACOCWA_04815 [Bacteroidota bacterium]